MYTYDAVPDAVAQVAELPVGALPAYAELIAFLELTPGQALPIVKKSPTAACGSCPSGNRTKAWPCTSSWRSNSASS